MSTTKVRIDGYWKDLVRFFRPFGERARRIRRASSDRPAEGRMTALAEALHPEKQLLKVSEIRIENSSTRTYRLVPEDSGGSVAPFRAGQYLSVEADLLGGGIAKRPYSLSGTPLESSENNAYDITIKTAENSFVAGIIRTKWSVGTTVRTSGPQGTFTYEPLRDPSLLICAAGGTGVTPFRSIIGNLLDKPEDATRIVLIQGAASIEEFLFDSEFREWEQAHPEKFRRILVLSEKTGPEEKTGFTGEAEVQWFEEERDCRRGYITAKIISEAINGEDAALFICGPEAMHAHLDEEISSLETPPRRIRREDYGKSGAPTDRDSWTMTVRIPGQPDAAVPADPGETVLVAMERAGLNPPSHCRTGACGWCRGRLVEGDVEYLKEPTGVRRGDREMGNFHPCIALPRTDIIVEMPENPASERR